MSEEYPPPEVTIKNLKTGQLSANPMAIGKAMQAIDQHHNNELVFSLTDFGDILACLNEQVLYQLIRVKL